MKSYVNAEYLSLLNFDVFHTYGLKEFCDLQKEQHNRVQRRMVELREYIAELVYEACQVK